MDKLKIHSVWLIPLTALIIGVVGGWRVNGWRIGNEVADLKAKYDKDALAISEQYREKEKKTNDKLADLEKTLIGANKQLDSILRDNAILLNKLHDRLKAVANAAKVSDPNNPTNAATGLVSRTFDIVEMCSARYSAMAEYAERLNNEKEFYKQSMKEIK